MQSIYNAVRLIVILSVSMVACTNKLELDPKQSVDAGEALLTDRDFQSAIVGAYALMGDGNLYGTNLNMIPELLASEDYCEWVGSFASFDDIYLKAMNNLNTEANGTWLQAYQTINVANNILANISRVQDEELKNTLEGEALFIRGIMHFELVRLYGLPYEAGQANEQPGVPVITEASFDKESASTKVGRSTVQKVYEQVIADLDAAAALLPEDNGTGADTYAATGFLARVYLQQSEYAKALEAANEVIESGKYQLGSFNSVFGNKNAPESIFEIQQNEQNNAGDSNDGLATFYANLPGIGRADIRPLDTVLTFYEDDDQRKINLFYTGDPEAFPPVSRPGMLASGKWTAFGQNIPVLRLAELVLIRAECNLRLGSATGDTPANDSNAIRERAGASTITNPTVEDVLKERVLELCFEGLRIHDFKRTKRSTGDFVYNAPELVMPVPKRELDANDLLEQNEGY